MSVKQDGNEFRQDDGRVGDGTIMIWSAVQTLILPVPLPSPHTSSPLTDSRILQTDTLPLQTPTVAVAGHCAPNLIYDLFTARGDEAADLPQSGTQDGPSPPLQLFFQVAASFRTLAPEYTGGGLRPGINFRAR